MGLTPHPYRQRIPVPDSSAELVRPPPASDGQRFWDYKFLKEVRMSFLSTFLPQRTAKPPARRTRPQLEALESRLVPYSVSGNAWLNPQLLTVSFVPDGTLLSSGVGGNGYNNLNATLNAKYATATWQAEILKGLQAWAQYANINFAVVADNGTTAGQGAYQQGDAG